MKRKKACHFDPQCASMWGGGEKSPKNKSHAREVPQRNPPLMESFLQDNSICLAEIKWLESWAGLCVS